MPHELVWGEIYFPPLLLVVVIAFFINLLISKPLAKLGIYNCTVNPALVDICIVCLLSVLLGRFLIQF
ncbi:DUF1656 domain-containing protein [Vibrio agarivorans]|nr:DUF1656 domain-containing protein [Vibrio agarivorans]MDN3660574.1 DUF1656 domain-containing protein [Vibrio agarivorans]